jgi:hypothetical protein
VQKKLKPVRLLEVKDKISVKSGLAGNHGGVEVALPPETALILTPWSLSRSRNPVHEFHQLCSVVLVFETACKDVLMG